MAENNLIPYSPASEGNLPGRNLSFATDFYRAPLIAEAETAPQSAPLSHYLWILRRQWWKITLFVALAVAATFTISSRLTPIYQSTSTIDIDRQIPSAIIGQESTRTMANDSDQFIATQAKLIQSDSVLRPAADQYNLLDTEGERVDSGTENPCAAQEAPVLLKRLKISRPPNTY